MFFKRLSRPGNQPRILGSFRSFLSKAVPETTRLLRPPPPAPRKICFSMPTDSENTCNSPGQTFDADEPDLKVKSRTLEQQEKNFVVVVVVDVGKRG